AKDLVLFGAQESRSFASLRMTILSGRKSLCVRDPINNTAGVVAQVHRPIAAERNPYRAPHPPAFLCFAGCQPSGNEVFDSALRLAFVVEFHAYYFVSGGDAAIPRSVEGREEVVAILGREHRSFIKRESERSRVRLHLDFRRDHALAAVISGLGEIGVGHAVAIAIGPAGI